MERAYPSAHLDTWDGLASESTRPLQWGRLYLAAAAPLLRESAKGECKVLDESTYRAGLAKSRTWRGVLGEADAVMATASSDLERASATGDCDDALAIGRRLVSDLERLIAEWPSRAPDIDQLEGQDR